jgi:hypothetical protein
MIVGHDLRNTLPHSHEGTSVANNKIDWLCGAIRRATTQPALLFPEEEEEATSFSQGTCGQSPKRVTEFIFGGSGKRDRGIAILAEEMHATHRMFPRLAFACAKRRIMPQVLYQYIS